MASRPRSLSVENLESRLNLSSLGGLSTIPLFSPATTRAQERSTLHKTKTVTTVQDYSHITLSSSSSQKTTTTTTSGSTVLAPTNLTATASSTSIALKWVDNSTNEQGFRVYRSTDGVNFSLIGSAGKGKRNYTDTTATVGTTYYYAVAAYNSNGQSALSNVASATETIAAPSAPTSLSAPTVTTSSVALTWADNASNENGYHVYRSSDGATYSLVADLSANSTTFTDSGLNSGTQYYYEVSAYNGGGETYVASSLAVITQTPTPAPSVTISAPAAPTALNFSNITTSSMTVNWSDASDNESGFHVYRSTDGTNYTLVGDVTANVTSFSDSSLSPSTTYSYKVSAWNATGETLSTAASGTTLALVVAPNAPSTPSFANITNTSLTVAWTDNSSNETGIRVYRSTDGVNFTKVADLAAGSTSFADSGLTAGTKYYYKTSAYNSAGETASAAASATTTAPVSTTTPVSIYTRSMTVFTELVIDGTSGNDSIVVTQSNGVLSITANGQTTTYVNTFGDIMIRGAAGDDTITVDSSVNIATLIYGGDGNNTIKNQTTAKATIVTIGTGVNTVTGNGINTAYWVNNGDTVNATQAEINLGGVNRVNNFYQPWTTTTTSPDYVPRTLYGQNLKDPTDAGTTTRLTANSFFGLGPTKDDINQTTVADCYWLAPLSSLAYSEPQRLMNMAVDLGDGTYAFRFVRSGVTSYVRVDGNLSVGGWGWGVAYAAPSANGNLWGSLFEKAYAYFRTGANSYSSLNWGYQSQSLQDLGLTTSSIAAGSGGTTVLNAINTQLSAGHAVVANTNGSITNAPLIASHVYSIIGAFLDSTGTVMIRLRNPWGVDGAGSDGANDGIVTISYAQFSANFGTITYSTM